MHRLETTIRSLCNSHSLEVEPSNTCPEDKYDKYRKDLGTKWHYLEKLFIFDGTTEKILTLCVQHHYTFT